jgi:hypothetical protein
MREERKSAIITHTHTNVHLHRHTVSFKGKQESFSFTLSFPLSLSFSSCLAFIQSSVMPSWWASNFLFQSLIIFIIYFIQIISTNDSHHQVLKADVGQDITMSCQFDEDKIEQVRRKKTSEYIACRFVYTLRKKLIRLLFPFQ